MARPSKIAAEDWNGPIRQAYETDPASDAVNRIAAKWGITPRRLRQVGAERGWERPPVIVTPPEPSSDARPARPTRPTRKRPDQVKIPAEVLAKATPEQLAVAGINTHKEPPPAKPKKKSGKPLPPKLQLKRAQEDADYRLNTIAPPLARSTAYAAAVLDPEQAEETFKQLVTQQVARTHALGGIFDTLTGMIMDALKPVDPNDGEALQAQLQVVQRLLPGRADTLAGVLTAARQLAEVLRSHEAGMLDVHIEAARRRSAQMKEEQEKALPAGEEDIAFEALSTEEQQALLEAALLLDGKRNAPDFPVPPTGPVVIEHQAEPPATP